MRRSRDERRVLLSQVSNQQMSTAAEHLACPHPVSDLHPVGAITSNSAVQSLTNSPGRGSSSSIFEFAHLLVQLLVRHVPVLRTPSLRQCLSPVLILLTNKVPNSNIMFPPNPSSSFLFRIILALAGYESSV